MGKSIRRQFLSDIFLLPSSTKLPRLRANSEASCNILGESFSRRDCYIERWEEGRPNPIALVPVQMVHSLHALLNFAESTAQIGRGFQREFVAYKVKQAFAADSA